MESASDRPRRPAYQADPELRARKRTLFERRAQRIANALSVTLGLSLSFLALSLVGAVGIWAVDEQNFPSLGLPFWWALQTVTTVGYGDVVPTTDVGRVVGGIEMVFRISFVALLIAGVTSAVLIRGEAQAEQIERTRKQRDIQTLNEASTQIQQAVARLGKHLDNFESRGGAS